MNTSILLGLFIQRGVGAYPMLSLGGESHWFHVAVWQPRHAWTLPYQELLHKP